MDEFLDDIIATKNGINIPPDRWAGLVDAAQKEKERKTGSVPRKPGTTPIDGPRPRRLQDVAAQLQFYVNNPELLKNESPGDTAKFLLAQVERIQEEFQEDADARRRLPTSLSRTRNIADVSRYLLDTANAVSSLRNRNPDDVAKILSAWGTVLIPFTDDGEGDFIKFTDKKGKHRSPGVVFDGLRAALDFANKRPGRAWRLLERLTDQYQEWLEAYLLDGGDEDEREQAQLLRRQPSARKLREDALRIFETPADRTPSPYPEFDKRWALQKQGTEVAEVEGSFQVPLRPVSRIGRHPERPYEGEIPQVIHTAPTLPPEIKVPTPRRIKQTSGPEPTIEEPVSPASPDDTEVVDIERKRAATLGKRAQRTSPSPNPIRRQEESPEPKLQRYSPPQNERQEQASAEGISQFRTYVGTQGELERRGYIDTSKPISEEQWQQVAFELGQTEKGTVIEKGGFQLSGAGLTAEDLAAIAGSDSE
jgi:hypothetical protein